jgi:hypothetical protein
VIVRQTEIPWAKPDAYALWAPDCIAKDGKYYFYFPTLPKAGEGFRVGVAVADQPTGPFAVDPQPIEGVHGIDPCVLLTKDGAAYLFFSHKQIFVAKLKANLRELDGPVTTIANLPTKGLLEGPFAFERGKYYLTYPHVENRIERLEYAVSDQPMGPYQPAGVILDESASGCWTVHQSIVEYRGEWFLFYHDRDLSPTFDKNRSIRADRLYFNDDGTIRKVVPTLRGVGVVDARSEIQLDRFSATSGNDVTVSFLDPANVHAGWKIALGKPASWVRFNDVDFGPGVRTAHLRARSAGGGTVEIHRDAPDGPVLARVEIPASADWQIVNAATKNAVAGRHDLVVTLVGGDAVELDWAKFE